MSIITLRPPRIAMVFTLIAALFQWILNLGESTRFSFPRAGIILGFIGFFIMMWAWLLFRRQKLAICPTAHTASIIKNGPYRFSRNPMYLGMVLMLFGLALYFGTVPFFLSAIGYFAIINYVFSPYEENKLSEAFGKEYEAYAKRVRRWL
jgi:protein-S-isoprenylcysteine O-methyltransferase Ste14